MSQENWAPKALAAVNAVSTATTGIKLSYTVPAGKRVRNAHVICQRDGTAGNLNARVAITLNGLGIIRNYVTPGDFNIVAGRNFDNGVMVVGGGAYPGPGFNLEAGDVIDFDVIVAVAASTAFICIMGEESLPGVF